MMATKTLKTAAAPAVEAEQDLAKVVKKEKIKKIIVRLLPLIGLVFLVVLFYFLSDGKLVRTNNLKSLFNQAFSVFICAIAGVFVMSTGNLDFSLGANMGLCATLACFAAFVSTSLALPTALLVGVAVGFLVGVIQIYAKLPSFIACLCMMFILMALAQSLTGGTTKMLPPSMLGMKLDAVKIIVLIVYIAAMYILFEYTRVGKQLKAMGISEETCIQSGIKTGRLRIIAYMLTGFAAGLAGYFTLLRTGCASYQIGSTMTIDVIIAIVLGGMAVTGGSSSRISAAIYGTLMTVVLDNGIVLSGLGGDAQQMIKGILFIIVVAISTKKDKNAVIA